MVLIQLIYRLEYALKVRTKLNQLIATVSKQQTFLPVFS